MARAQAFSSNSSIQKPSAVCCVTLSAGMIWLSQEPSMSYFDGRLQPHHQLVAGDTITHRQIWAVVQTECPSVNDTAPC